MVLIEDAFSALDALQGAGFRSVTPVKRSAEPEPMYVLQYGRGTGEVDLLVAAGEPESTVVAEAPLTKVFCATAHR